ncbi:hypothetical protein H5T51_06855 [Candidatus Bathyarchaeota archaeon]|nr:hypothetical protein [Candidatus Bathyarchaeota archaeon]
MKLIQVIEEIASQRKCTECPLKESRKPLVVKPRPISAIKAVVVTESPWQYVEDIERLTSIANVYIFPYLYCLLSGNFRPRENANTYWTHTCKCYLKGTSPQQRKRAIEICSEAYLRSEIEAVQPKLVVAVGNSALKYFARQTRDNRLRGELTNVFLKQANGIFENVKLGSANFSLAVVPHPSGKNRFWNKMPLGTVQTFKQIIKDIKEVIS